MNIAVIGAGIMGYNHIRVLSESDEANVVAVADIDKDKLTKIQKIFRIPRVYTSHKDLIAKENPDAFIIAAPTSLHKEIVLACLEKNRPVFFEKLSYAFITTIYHQYFICLGIPEADKS